MQATAEPVPQARGSALEVLAVFLRLGVSSFGGPIAHLGYFRDEFVLRRRWMDERAYAELVGLCQFLPGPASSQVGFSIGLARAGTGKLASDNWAKLCWQAEQFSACFSMESRSASSSLSSRKPYSCSCEGQLIVRQSHLNCCRRA